MANNHSNERHWMVLVLMLKEIAQEKSVTQEKIEDLTGMTQSAISRFFALKYKPRLDTFLLIANALQVNFFFEDRESTTPLNKCFERAMTALGRRPDRLPKN